MANIEELRLILKEIKANPDSWDQTAWGTNFDRFRFVLDNIGSPACMKDIAQRFVAQNRCGTAYCVAGHAVVRAGYQMVWVADVSEPYAEMCQLPGQEERYVIDVAQELLGLSLNQAVTLFSSNNTLEDLERIVDEIENGELE